MGCGNNSPSGRHAELAKHLARSGQHSPGLYHCTLGPSGPNSPTKTPKFDCLSRHQRLCNNSEGRRIMDQPARPFTSEGTDARRWFGRIIIAVLLGEALWGLIVSVMNNVFVPWLGDFMGQSSGLPTSFTQRPYNYPELFVSVFEFCIAGLVAAILNYFFQRPGVAKVRIVKSPVPAAPAGPIRVVPQTTTPAPSPASPIAPVQVAKADSVLPPAPVVAAPVVPAPVGAAPVRPAPVIAAPAPPPAVAPAPVVRPVAAVPPAPAAANPVPAKPQVPAAKVEPAKPKKAKEVYYNIVGEPMPSDDD